MRRIALAAILIGCGPHHGGGNQVDATGGGGDDSSTSNANCGQLVAQLRDFRSDHPDFEHVTNTDDHGIVAAELGTDGKPVYAHTGGTPSVSSPMSFDQWYRDTSGVNMHFDYPLALVEGPPHVYTYDNQQFFPLDGKGWPNTEVFGHNFWFTTEIHATFKYRGGEHFKFDGDDDVFVFVNRKLAIDLGGVHVAESGTVDFDARATELGLELGKSYPLDVFHAERHTDQSHFRMETTIDCIVIE